MHTPIRADTTRSALDLAENATRRLSQGDYRAAARDAKLALGVDPTDSTVLVLAGTVLLETGASSRALKDFDLAVSFDPNDGLAAYGRGLAQMGAGRTATALAGFELAGRLGGPAAYIDTATAYAGWLRHATSASKPASLAAATPAQQALAGMRAQRSGAIRQAISDLERALSGAGGGPVDEPIGALMTFDRARPIGACFDKLAAAEEPLAAVPVGSLYAGEVQLEPGAIPQGVAAVSYQVDSGALSVVNVPPFSGRWDSLRAPNGWHTVDVTLYDASGAELGKAQRRICTHNPGDGSLARAPGERVAALRKTLWDVLKLAPDRCACAYTLSGDLRSLGAASDADRWLLVAAAIDPDYRDCLTRLAAHDPAPDSGEPIWGGLPNAKVVALTFDDGPKPGVTESLVAELKRENVPATFFVIGSHVLQYPDVTLSISRAGFEVANHTFTHRNLVRLSQREVEREMLKTQAAVDMVTGRRPSFVRPPGGDWNSHLAGLARECGLTPCFWSVDAFDAEIVGSRKVAETVLRQVQPGSIILMHNGKMDTIEALPTIVGTLRSRGYTFVSARELARRLSQASPAMRREARIRAIANTRKPE